MRDTEIMKRHVSNFMREDKKVGIKRGRKDNKDYEVALVKLELGKK
jgi:hypothetical protein